MRSRATWVIVVRSHGLTSRWPSTKRAERDDPFDDVRPAHGQDAREQAAAALADDRHPRLEQRFEPVDRGLGAVGVDDDVRAPRRVAVQP
jgi:hypothetical protein